MKLNLGCGSQALAGWVNVDMIKQDGVDVVWNLDSGAWPFEDDTASEIRAIDIFEHVNDSVLFMAECHRILEVGATLCIRTSYWKSENAYTNPTHKRFCTEHTFDFWVYGTEFFQRYGASCGGHDHPYDKVSVGLDGQELVATLRKRR